MKRNRKTFNQPTRTKVECHVSLNGHIFRFSGNMLAIVACPVAFQHKGRYSNVFGGNGLMNEINTHLINNCIFDGQDALDYVLSIGGQVIDADAMQGLLAMIASGDAVNLNLAKIIGTSL